jgi:hypothetical protein
MLRNISLSALMIAASGTLVLPGSACADELPILGRGVFCDAASEAEQFFRAEMKEDAYTALQLVNKEKTVCAIGPVIYFKREKALDVTEKNMKVEIVKITVVGAFDPKRAAWVHTAPLDQFTLFYPDALAPSI